MNATRIDTPPELPPPPRLRLDVLLIYEDGPTGLRGRHALDRVLRRPELMADGRFHAWRLDVLRDSACREDASRAALKAHIIVLSMHGGQHLAPEIEASLNKWVSSPQGGPRALVISLDACAKPLGKAAPMLLELRSAARLNGLMVLLQFGEAPRPETNAVISSIGLPVKRSAADRESRFAQPEPFGTWGINE